MGISLSKVAETKICGFPEFPHCFCSFSCARFDHIVVPQHILDFYQIFFDRHKFLSLHQSVVIMRIGIPKGPIFYVFQHKAKCNIQLCCTLSRTLCLISCSNCVNPASAKQNGKLCVSHFPSQSL